MTDETKPSTSERDEATFEQWYSEWEDRPLVGLDLDALHKPNGRSRCIFHAATRIERSRVAEIVEKIEGLPLHDMPSDGDDLERNGDELRDAGAGDGCFVIAADVLELLKELRND